MVEVVPSTGRLSSYGLDRRSNGVPQVSGGTVFNNRGVPVIVGGRQCEDVVLGVFLILA